MSALKDETINHIIKIEGGYVNDPDDSGGETNFGVTEKVARANGYHGKMIDMPKETAFNIYAEQYWDAINLDEIEKYSHNIAKELADTGVNMGTGRAAEFLQRSLNALNSNGTLFADLTVDRDIGPSTLKAFNAYLTKRGTKGELVLFRALNCLQGVFYIELVERREKDEAFIYGWLLNRVV
jgi:lysozyme family protein